MKDINALIVQNFNDNISYIQTNHRELFSKLSALDNAISHGHYQEKYELRYDNDYFDVFEKSTQKFLYAKNSSKHAELAAQSVNYKVDENLFNGFHQHDITDSELLNYETMPPFEHEMSGFSPIMHYTQKHLPEDKVLRSLNKFVFFGVGLGLHVESIHNKISAKSYFIIEDDLELFRLSLFTTNYAKIANESRLFFSVFEEGDEFQQSSTNFLEDQHYYNHHIKFFHILSHNEEKIDKFQVAIASQSHLLFYYNTLLTQFLTPLQYLFKEYYFIDKTVDLNTNELKKKPFLILGAGPSLEKNREWLQKNHKNFIIVAVSATLQFLERESIRPDIIVQLDAFDTSIKFFDELKSIEFLNRTLFLFTDRISDKIVNRLNKEHVFFFENGTTYKENSLKPSAPCVGSISYQLLLFFKVNNIYMLGVDLAIDSQTGSTHSDSHVYSDTISIEEHSQKSDLFTYEQTLLKVPGNFGEDTLTTAQLHTSIDSLNSSTKILKKDFQRVVNLSDGAKFLDMEAVKPNALVVNELNEKEKTIDIICNSFVKKSSTQMTNSEITNIEKKITHAKRVIERVENYKNISHISSKQYIDHIIRLNSDLLPATDILEYELCRVVDTYFRYILTYIFDFLNIEGVGDDNTHIEHLHKILTEHILKITTYYIDNVSDKMKN